MIAGRILSRNDFVIGTVIAIAMATVFTIVSSGRSLIVTFVPGLVVAWLIYLWLYVKGHELPDADHFVPLFFVALSLQFLHFAEEFVTDFKTLFPVLYGGVPYSNNLFVTFNMVSYAVFVLSCLLVFYRGLRFLLVPVLFYVVYGAVGNAITHTWWVVHSGRYFPGFFTALAYWVLGPWLLYRLMAHWRYAIAVVVVFAILLVPLVTVAMARPA
jgi:hypothetical protein